MLLDLFVSLKMSLEQIKSDELVLMVLEHDTRFLAAMKTFFFFTAHVMFPKNISVLS